MVGVDSSNSLNRGLTSLLAFGGEGGFLDDLDDSSSSTEFRRDSRSDGERFCLRPVLSGPTECRCRRIFRSFSVTDSSLVWRREVKPMRPSISTSRDLRIDCRRLVDRTRVSVSTESSSAKARRWV